MAAASTPSPAKSQPSSSGPTLTTCPVCQDDYEEPKLLPCAHRICRKCLLEWLASSTEPPSCPVCHRHIKHDRTTRAKSSHSQPVAGKTSTGTIASIGSSDTTSATEETEAACQSVAVCAVSQKSLGNDSGTKSPASTQSASHVPSVLPMPDYVSPSGEVSAAEKKSPTQVPQANTATAVSPPDVCDSSSNTSSAMFDKVASLSETKNDSSGEEKRSKTDSPGSRTKSDDVISLVDGLPTDAVLMAILGCARKLRPPHTCSICQGDKIAFDFCIFCEEKLCQLCSLHHSRMAITRHHEVKNIDNLTPIQLARNSRERCPKHPDQFLELYCPVHFQPTCFSCYPVHHGGCGSIDTATDAASRQRQVVQKQMTSLLTASEEIMRHKQKITDNQLQARKDITALGDRLSTAVQALQDGLLAKVNKISPISGLQGTDVQDWQWLTTAHQQLVSEICAGASDVNMIRMSGALAARAARLAAEAPKPALNTYVLFELDERSVNDALGKLQSLGVVHTLSLPKKDKDRQTKAQAVQAAHKNGSPADSESMHTVASLDPFTWNLTCTMYRSRPGVYVEQHQFCLTDSDILFIVEDNKKIWIRSITSSNRDDTLTHFPEGCRTLCLLENGVVGMTTESNVIYFFYVNKCPVDIRKLSTKKGYWGIAPGFNGELIVTFDGTPPSIDVISRDGQLLKTLTPENQDIGRPHFVCRWGNDVFVADVQNMRVLKTTSKIISENPFDSERGFSWLHHPAIGTMHHITTDYHGRLYISNHDSVLVTDTMGRWKILSPKYGSYGHICVCRDGRLFVCGYAGDGFEVLLHKFTDPNDE